MGCIEKIIYSKGKGDRSVEKVIKWNCGSLVATLFFSATKSLVATKRLGAVGRKGYSIEAEYTTPSIYMTLSAP